MVLLKGITRQHSETENIDMKRALSCLFFILLIPSLFAAEPAIIFSLAAPSIIYAESGGKEEIIVTEELSQKSHKSLLLPCKVADSDIRLASSFSINPIRVARFAWNAYDVFQSLEAIDFQSVSGLVYFQPLSDYESGQVSLSINYDEVILKAKEGRALKNYSLDGKLNISVSFFTDSLIDFTIATDEISVSGNTDASNNTLTIRFRFNADKGYEYLQSYDIETARRISTGFLMRLPLFEKLGFDSSSDFEDLIAFAEDNEALDIIDSIAFILLAMSDNTLSEEDIFSMVTTPVLYENGIESEDIDLSKGVEAALAISAILK